MIISTLMLLNVYKSQMQLNTMTIWNNFLFHKPKSKLTPPPLDTFQQTNSQILIYKIVMLQILIMTDWPALSVSSHLIFSTSIKESVFHATVIKFTLRICISANYERKLEFHKILIDYLQLPKLQFPSTSNHLPKLSMTILKQLFIHVNKRINTVI